MEEIRKNVKQLTTRQIANFLEMSKLTINKTMMGRDYDTKTFKRHKKYPENFTFLNPTDYSQWWTNIPNHEFGYGMQIYHYLGRNIDHLRNKIKRNPDYYSITENLKKLFDDNLNRTREHDQFNGKITNPAKQIMFNKILNKMGQTFEFPNTPYPHKKKKKKH